MIGYILTLRWLPIHPKRLHPPIWRRIEHAQDLLIPDDLPRLLQDIALEIVRLKGQPPSFA
ncbi:MAG: hypothetical protein ACRERE_45640 [Candidatus Entotheonellia bacterium]